MLSAGDIIAKLKFDRSDFTSGMAAATKRTNKFAKQMNSKNVEMQKSTTRFAKSSIKHAEAVGKGWWRTFGKVAVGFTIAYRAMNAFEEGFKAFLRTFASGRQEIDDFRMSVVKVAASLQMLTDQPTTEGLEAYYQFARSVFNNLEVIAAKHISTGEDLRDAYTKLATMGIVPTTEKQLEQMARLVDLIVMQTTGQDKQRQILTEIRSLVKGEIKPQAVVANLLSERVLNYKKVVKEVKEENSVVKKTKMLFEAIHKPLDAIGAVSKDIQKTHTALWTTLEAYLAKIQRLGLLQMYEDLLDTMINIRDAIIDQNGLTDFGIRLAVIYHQTWAAVWSVVYGVGSVLRDIFWLMSPLITSLKGLAALTVLILAGWEKIGAVIKAVLKRATFDYSAYHDLAIILTNIHEKMVKSLEDIFITPEQMRAKYLAGMKKDQEEITNQIKKWSTGQKKATDETIKMTEKWTKSIEKLKSEYAVLSKTLAFIEASEFFTPEDIKSTKWLYKLLEDAKKVPEEFRSAWMQTQIAISRSNKEIAKGVEKAKELENLETLKERAKIAAIIYKRLDLGEILRENLDYETKLLELEFDRKHLAKIIGDTKAAEVYLYEKELLDIEKIYFLEKKHADDYIQAAKDRAAIEFADYPAFDYESLIAATAKTSVEGLESALRLQNQMLKQAGRSRLVQSENEAALELKVRRDLIQRLEVDGDTKNALMIKAREAYANRILEINGTIVDGMRKGHKDVIDSLKTSFEIGEIIVKEGSSALIDAFENSFVNLMEADLDSLTQTWRNFGHNVQKIIAQILAEQTKAALFGKESGLITQAIKVIAPSILGSSDLVTGAVLHQGMTPIQRQSGGWIPEPVLGRGLRSGKPYTFAEHEPEMVNPGSQSNGSGGGIMEITINAVDAKSFAELASSNPGAITGPFIKALSGGDRALRSALRSAK